MVTKALLEGSLKGVGKFHKTPIFPCGIFQYKQGVNDKPGTPNYDLKKLAIKSTVRRLYPNYANCDWSVNDSAIDYDRVTVYQIEQQMAKVQFSNSIKRAKDFIANYDATLGMSNKANAAVYCFRAKNMYGMKDVQEIKASSDFTTDPRTPEDVVAALPDMDESKFIEIKTN